ncbi:hypothetical protein ATANTOWER_016566, partial [Ataeniobius toweri]|nr:hypothetical protein [Ataeniobius toweri]
LSNSNISLVLRAGALENCRSGPSGACGVPVCAASRTSGEQKSCTVNSVLVTAESTEGHREGGSTRFDRQCERTCRDGGYETSPLIDKFCGGQRPPVLVSHSNRLWIRFHSDATITHRGFVAHWDGSQTGCGGTLTTAAGGLSSPNYPLPYHPNAECYWNIRTSQGSQLQLSFSDFHLESSSSCSFDYLA